MALTKVFVYGTLKKGERNHALLAKSKYWGKAVTAKKYRIYSNGSYPCMVRAEDGNAILGELYEVNEETLAHLDRLEGVSFGLYERAQIDIPGSDEPIYGYLFLQNLNGLKPLDTYWDAREHSEARRWA